jgi:predicted ATPase/class 3 adenylate cyclase
MPNLPTGTVTFLFTDIEGSTRLWQGQPAAMAAALARHDAILRAAVAAHRGHVIKTTGDGLHAVFVAAPAALAATIDAQRALRAETWPAPVAIRVRMGLHTGSAEERDGDYFGTAVNRAARLMAAGHGGQILLSQATADLARDALPAGAGLVDLGAHRLRDLPQPEPIFQLRHPHLPATFPPLKALGARAPNLPLQVTSFVGREREIGEVRQRLATTRLLTLTGSGGCGKTRLALQVAADLLDAYPDGVWLVELAPLAEPALVPDAVAAALGVREAPGEAIQATLLAFLRTRRLLLLLDNCEHLIDACAHLATALLRTCPEVRILATSRQALGIAGEVGWRVPSLAVPPVEQQTDLAVLAQSEAIRLFVERAGAVQPAFALAAHNAPSAAQICRRLDGIPLAIELAAARMRVLTPEQIAARLDDQFRLLTGGSRTALPRQQTLRATIDWSHDLLTEPERHLFRRLAVFAGGFGLEAAEHVGGAEDAPPPDAVADVLGVLAALVEKSLVQVDAARAEMRYTLLQTVRQYAGEKLLDAGEAEAVRARHRAWYLGLAEQALPELEGHDQKRWADRLEDEHDNLRAALAWSAANPADSPALLRLAAVLGKFWRRRGYNREAIGWLELAVARSGTTPSGDRALALDWLGHCEWIEGNVERAGPLLEESVAQARTVGDRKLLAMALGHLSYTAISLGDRARARRLLEEALAVGRAVGYKREVASALYDLAGLLMREDALEAIEPLLVESLSTARESGDATSVCKALLGLSCVYHRRGASARARNLLEECLALARRTDARWHIMWTLFCLGDLAAAEQDLDGAIDWYRQSLRLVIDVHRGWAAYLLGRYAALRAARGDPRRAARLYGAASTAPRGDASDPSFFLFARSAGAEEDVAAVRLALGEGDFAAAWAVGQAMTLEQAVAYALEEDTGTLSVR